MMGQVRGPFAWLPVSFVEPAAPEPIVCAIDTGFTGFLVLPSEMVAALGLKYLYPSFAVLANGTQVTVPLHDATIRWGGTEYVARVFAMGTRPLLGTALLAGHRLVADFVENGAVTVEML